MPSSRKRNKGRERKAKQADAASARGQGDNDNNDNGGELATSFTTAALLSRRLALIERNSCNHGASADDDICESFIRELDFILHDHSVLSTRGPDDLLLAVTKHLQQKNLVRPFIAGDEQSWNYITSSTHASSCAFVTVGVGLNYGHRYVVASRIKQGDGNEIIQTCDKEKLLASLATLGTNYLLRMTPGSPTADLCRNHVVNPVYDSYLAGFVAGWFVMNIEMGANQ